MAGTKNHEYHILDPDPWPLIGAFSALALTGGGVMWMHDNPYGMFISIAGFIGVIVTMFNWWSNTVKEAHEGHHTPVVSLHLRYGMIMFIASEVMFFVAWFWAFFNAALFPPPVEVVDGAVQTLENAASATYPPPGVEVLDPFGYPLLNTLILLCSGTTVTWAHHALLNGDREGLKKGLLATIVLGFIFTCVQAYEYAHAPFAFSTANGGTIYSSTFFMATGFHGAHVIIGTIFLTVCYFRALKGHFTPKQHFGFEAAAWYWHFVDVVWLFLFVCIYIWGSWGAPIH